MPHLIDDARDTLRLVAELTEAARRQGLGVTVVFDCAADAEGARHFTTDFRDAVNAGGVVASPDMARG